MSKYPVMDPTGKARSWLEAGRGIRVWPCQALDSARGDLLTPGDVTNPAHWSYTLESSRLLGPEDVTFFRRSDVATDDTGRPLEWSDSPAGYLAAQRALRGLPDENPASAPLRMRFRYTIETLQYETRERVPLGDGVGDRPLATRFRVAVIRWVAIIRQVAD